MIAVQLVLNSRAWQNIAIRTLVFVLKNLRALIRLKVTRGAIK